LQAEAGEGKKGPGSLNMSAEQKKKEHLYLFIHGKKEKGVTCHEGEPEDVAWEKKKESSCNSAPSVHRAAKFTGKKGEGRRVH